MESRANYSFHVNAIGDSGTISIETAAGSVAPETSLLALAHGARLWRLDRPGGRSHR